MGNVLGIDPSTVATGWGVVNKKGELIAHGVIAPDKKTLSEVQQAAFQYNSLSHIIKEYNIEAVICEDQHKGANSDTYKKLCRITGYVQLLAGLNELPFEFFHPSSWRKITLGNGKATKEDAIQWVNETYGLKLLKKQNDIAEGIAIAKAGTIHFEEIL